MNTINPADYSAPGVKEAAEQAEVLMAGEEAVSGFRQRVLNGLIVLPGGLIKDLASRLKTDREGTIESIRRQFTPGGGAR